MPSRLFVAGLVLMAIAGTSIVLAQANTGVITGMVTEGTRPQPGLEVVLTDSTGKVQSKTKTNEKGMFEFKDLAVGTYKVSSSKPVTGRKGSADANVTAGKTVVVTITLLQ